LRKLSCARARPCATVPVNVPAAVKVPASSVHGAAGQARRSPGFPHFRPTLPLARPQDSDKKPASTPTTHARTVVLAPLARAGFARADLVWSSSARFPAATAPTAELCDHAKY